MQGKNDPMEQILKRAVQSRQQDDIERFTLRQGDKEFVYLERRHDISFVPDPMNPGSMIARTEYNQIRSLDDNGVQPNMIGFCAFGHFAADSLLSFCPVCRKRVCIKHGLRIGQMVYCRKGSCIFVARLHQAYRMVRFCFLNIFGLYKPEDDVSSGTPESDIFETERKDLNESEKE